MKKRLFQASLLAVIFGLMLLGSATGVLGLESASAANFASAVDSEWRLLIDGSVQNTLDLTLSELEAMPKSTVYAELYCYGRLLYWGYWTGVKLGLLLEEAGLDENAELVEFHAQDGYEIELSISEATQDNVIIAYERDGEPLPETLRLVAPGANGNFWISMITQITIIGEGSNDIPEMTPLATIIIMAVVTCSIALLVKKSPRQLSHRQSVSQSSNRIPIVQAYHMN